MGVALALRFETLCARLLQPTSRWLVQPLPRALRAGLCTWLSGLLALGAASLSLLLQSHLMLNHPPPGTLDC